MLERAWEHRGVLHRFWEFCAFWMITYTRVEVRFRKVEGRPLLRKRAWNVHLDLAIGLHVGVPS